MKKTMKKVLALVLAVLMCGSFVLPAMAAGATTGCPGVGVAHTLDNCTDYKTHKTYAPTCEKDGYTHYQCNVCSVYFADSWVDRPNEDGECEWEVTTKASCFADGVKTCKNCGATEAIAKRSHVMEAVDGSPVCGAPGTKVTRKCTRTANDNYEACTHTDEIAAGEDHDWIITVTVQPSCGVKGEAKYTCEDCGYFKTMEIYSTGDHVLEEVAEVANTCTTDGNVEHDKCKVCGLLFIDDEVVDEEDVIVKAEHSFNAEEPTAIVYPTCTTPGFKFFGCTVCGQTADTEELPMLPHITRDEDKGKTKAADVTLTGGTTITELDCVAGTDLVVEYECIGNRCTEDTNTNNPHTTPFTWRVTEMKLGSEESVEEGHVIAPVVVKPNCTEKGYTYNNCAICGQIGEEYNETEIVADAHIWVNATPIQAAGCTTPGVAVAYCEKCNLVDDTHVVEALGHSWERGTNPLATHDYVRDCKNGVLVYTCTDDNCDDTANNKFTTPIDEDFDIDDITWHRDYVGGSWTGAYNEVREGSCTVGSVETYGCSCGYTILVMGEASHVKDESSVVPYLAPYCLTDGHYGSWDCSVCHGTAYTDADGDIVVFVEADEDVNDLENFSVTIPKLSKNDKHTNKTVYKKASSATCTTAGNTEGWYCNVCCNFVADADEDPEDANDAPTITLKPGAVYNAEKPAYELSTVIDPLDHEDKYIDDWANLATDPDDEFIIGTDGRIVRVPTCLEYAYAHYVCPDCGLEYWDNYKKELGHDTEKVVISADCDNGGFNLVVCEREDLCDLEETTYGTDSYKVVEEEKVGRLYHKDADGNPIKCVKEDFYCSVCSPNTLVAWAKSHDYTQKHYYATCISPAYTLYSCSTCNDGIVVEDTIGDKGDHNYAADTNPPAGATTSDDGKWTITKAPTYAAAGSRYQKCTVCGETVTDNNYVKTDMKLSFTTTNAKNGNATFVNSGLIALTVKTHAYKLPVWGLELSIKYNNQLVAFEGFDVNNASFKDTTKVASKNIELDNGGVVPAGYVDRDEVVTILAYAGNGADGKAQNVELNGDGTALVTVYFRILDNTIGETAAFTVVADSVEVVDKTPAEKTVSSVGTIPSVAIKALGDVNGDEAQTAVGVATVADAIALQLIIDKNDNTYNAMADIDKDGKVTVADFGYLMQYISGQIDYNELCAIGVKA